MTIIVLTAFGTAGQIETNFLFNAIITVSIS